MIIRDLCKFLDLSRLNEPVSIKLTPLLLRTSLALNYETEKLYCMASKRAVVVLPIPGYPLIRAAFEFIFPEFISFG